MIEFTPWPKISRLFRDIVVTEKIDGSHAAVGIKVVPLGEIGDLPAAYAGLHHDERGETDGSIAVYAQSRNRIITPAADNHGFAKWVHDNAQVLAGILGPGLHYGEWWGSGINRGYGLQKGEKRFSLFNTKRWSKDSFDIDHQCSYIPPELGVVPVLYSGAFSTVAVEYTKADLSLHGSYASPGFMNPEGVVIYHAAGNVMFKSTLRDDEVPKVVAERKRPDLALAA